MPAAIAIGIRFARMNKPILISRSSIHKVCPAMNAFFDAFPE
jgi:hypothetical protein